MNNFPSAEIVEQLRTQYPKGTRIELIEMNDPWRKMPEGLRGTVDYVDDIGTIHIHWDNGSSLGVVYGVDRIRRMNE